MFNDGTKTLTIDCGGTITTDVCTLTISDIFQPIIQSVEKKSDFYGTRIKSSDGKLYLIYLDQDDNEIGTVDIMPDIINVQKPNDTTVFVEFDDGTKEVAHLRDGDEFCLETGILICLAKKIFSNITGVNGSTVYNKIIKYALSKLDYSKKEKEKAKKEAKEFKKKIAEERRYYSKLENKQREERIREMAEAYERAMNEYAKKTSEVLAPELEEFFNALLKDTSEDDK